MIRFKRPEDVLPSALILLSLLILASTLAFVLFVPRPGAARGAKSWASTRRRLADNVVDTKAQERRARAAIRPRLWHSDPESVTATILNQLSAQSAYRHLKLTAFRPERGQEFDGMTEMRFTAQMAGPYPAVHTLLRSLDARGSKIALRSVSLGPSQLGPAQASSGDVSASLGLSAFVATDPDLAPPAETARASGQTTGGSHG